MGLELTTLVVIGTNCTGSWKSNYHTITTTTTPCPKVKTYWRINLISSIILIIWCSSLLPFPKDGNKENSWCALNKISTVLLKSRLFLTQNAKRKLKIFESNYMSLSKCLCRMSSNDAKRNRDEKGTELVVCSFLLNK